MLLPASGSLLGKHINEYRMGIIVNNDVMRLSMPIKTIKLFLGLYMKDAHIFIPKLFHNLFK